MSVTSSDETPLRSASETPALVTAPVTVLWRTPEAPRGVDAPMLADVPDEEAWLAAMDAETDEASNRFGLDDRIETQLVAGEPVLVLDEDERGWSQVVARWQPQHDDPRGYPGYVRSAHLGAGQAADPFIPGFATVGLDDAGSSGTDEIEPAEAFDIRPLVESARAYLDMPYLWGGCSTRAIDCSGLIHRAAREHGVLVPRDAGDQQVSSVDVPLGSERFGDLYFFAHPGKDIHHVGFVIEPGVMLHAPGTGNRVVEEPMSQDRVDTLVAAGRLPGSRLG